MKTWYQKGSDLGEAFSSHYKAIVFSVLLNLFNSGVTLAGDQHIGWHFNFTPALVAPKDGYDLGGGVDPEVRYSFGVAGAYLSCGARTGAYYAKNLFGTMVMPTARLTIPIGALDAYVAFGSGYGWVPKLEQSDVARMYRGGIIYHFSEKLGLGVEGTQQEVIHSDFRFFSLGSMVSFGL